MAAPHLDKPESPRAGFRVIRDEDAPSYDGQAQAKQKFTMIPEIVRQMNDGFAVAVFEAIARNDNGNHECWPSVATICERTGWSRKVVEPAIKRLIAAGALVKESRKLNGMDQANLYRITAWKQVVPTAPPVVPTAPLGSSHGTSGSFPQNYKQEPVNQEPIEQEPPTGDKPLPLAEPRQKPKRNQAPDYSADFLERFWSRYPVQERNSRKRSWELWQRMSLDDHEAAIAALPAFVACDGWKRGFIPGAQVWLGERRWEDPPKPQAATSNGLAIVGGQKVSKAQTAVERALAIGRGEA